MTEINPSTGGVERDGGALWRVRVSAVMSHIAYATGPSKTKVQIAQASG